MPEAHDAPNNFYRPIEQEDRTEGNFSRKARGFSLYDLFEKRSTAGTLLALGAALLFTRLSGTKVEEARS